MKIVGIVEQQPVQFPYSMDILRLYSFLINFECVADGSWLSKCLIFGSLSSIMSSPHAGLMLPKFSLMILGSASCHPAGTLPWCEDESTVRDVYQLSPSAFRLIVWVSLKIRLCTGS